MKKILIVIFSLSIILTGCGKASYKSVAKELETAMKDYDKDYEVIVYDDIDHDKDYLEGQNKIFEVSSQGEFDFEIENARYMDLVDEDGEFIARGEVYKFNENVEEELDEDEMEDLAIALGASSACVVEDVVFDILGDYEEDTVLDLCDDLDGEFVE